MTMLTDRVPSPEAPRLVAGRRPPLGAYDADIIILSMDRCEDTIAAITSALAQRGVSYHVTVLDQGSQPDTLRQLKRAFGRSPDFALYAIDANLGVAGGRNLATSLGHGQIITALDNDAVFAHKWILARALRQFNQNPEIGALAFNILRADGAGPDRFSWGYPARLLGRFKERFNTTTFVGAGHAIRRTSWNAAGGYDPAFFFTWEEYDLCLRVIALGWRVVYDGSLAIIHKVSPDRRIRWSNERMTFYVRNRLMIGRKWGASWPALAPRICGYLFRAILNRRLKPTIAGIRQAIEADAGRGQRMPKAMRQYVYANETRHRGGWLDRLRFELLAPLRRDM